MELGLSLGENSRPPFTYTNKMNTNNNNKGLGFCMSLGLSAFSSSSSVEELQIKDREEPHHQLDLLPLAPVPRNQATPLHFLSENGNSSGGVRGFDVNQFPSTDEADDEAATAVSSPNSTVSSFQIDFAMYNRCGNDKKRDAESAGLNDVEAAERTSSRGHSDDDENASARKKLRLSKEQSAFLEESFKEHNTLNPKQKLALAKQLNLRPRQVEVWFQNRRARTKLKQTEVDCEYLKRCCDTLTEENRRLQKEIQELRALKTSHPYYMQLPATTLTMCPSCERVATTGAAATENSTITSNNTPNKSALSLTKPRFYPFNHPHPHQSAAPS